MSALDEIEARLSAATPGPWLQRDPGQVRGVVYADGRDAVIVRGPGTADNDLIAHAPADLAALLTFARRVEEILGDHVSTNEQVFDDLDRAMKRLTGGAA